MSKFDTSIVDATSSTCDGDAKYNARYILTIYKQVAKPRPVTAIVILKNPASTCKDTIFFSTKLDQIYDVDKTTTHVINTLFAKGSPYDKIITCNLFPYFDNIPSTINSVYSNLLTGSPNSYTENLNKITTTIQQNHGADIFCAWGQSSGITSTIYDKAIKDIIHILRSNNITIYYTFNNGKRQSYTLPVMPFYPIHGSKW